ncbi:MAG: DEAD/DEAH box helicase [Treponema sp.]|nr:DEAD/DEAH box helicase [Treponema sp.]
MQAHKRFSKAAILHLKQEIQDSGGNEVFALGFLDDKKLITRVQVSARGNESTVLALDNEDADVLIHNHPSGNLVPSDNDLIISSRAAESGIGSYIVDNQVEEVYVVAEPVKRRPLKALDAPLIRKILEPQGEVSRRLDPFEIRESQLDLMDMIVQGFNEDALVAAEAGTGVGKSLAYLIPAISYATANDTRIVISTATINLQEQLFQKDIPLVRGALKSRVKAVLIKGRGNYICRRRMADARSDSFLDEEEQNQINEIALWAETCETGSRSDLSFLPLEPVWSRVCSEADTCMHMRCPLRESCFVMLLRRESLEARILVVNHHLLFADLAARRDGAGYTGAVVLPPYERVILDEAHTLEESATSFFSREFSRLGIYRQLGRLYRRRRNVRSGLLVRLISFLPPGEGIEKRWDQIEEALEGIREAMDKLDEGALELCAAEGVFRLIPARDPYIKARLVPELLSLRRELNSLSSFIKELLEDLHDEDSEDPVIWEIRSILRRLDTVGSICLSFVEYQENEEEVMWIEGRSGSRSSDAPWAVFSVSPINIAPPLKEALFDPHKTVVCLSATLTTSGSFHYWMTRSGLALIKEREIYSGIFPSPFPYQSKVLLAAVQEAPLPTDQSYRPFVDQAALALTEVACGSALVLFTSYQALRSAHEAALPVLQKQGIRVLKQGDDDRTRLLQTFLSDQSSVLFATDSFWEGVDAPGDTLRLVILCRLPFKSPSDPVFEARSDAIKARGGSAFMELSLPEAVMKFKQGFGRLMRKSSDHGVVVVLDGRLLRMQYGQYFLDSLPETLTCFGDLPSILRKVENFLF